MPRTRAAARTDDAGLGRQRIGIDEIFKTWEAARMAAEADAGIGASPPPRRQASATAATIAARRSPARTAPATGRHRPTARAETAAASRVSIEWQQYSRGCSPSGMIEICDLRRLRRRRSGLRSNRNTAQRGHGSGTTLMLPQGSGMPLAAVHRAQEPRRIGIEEMPVAIRRDRGHAPHHHRRGHAKRAPASTECASRMRKRRNGARGHISAAAKKLHSKSRQA